MKKTNRQMKPLNVSVQPLVSVEGLRKELDAFSLAICQSQFFAFLITPALYSWIVMLLLSYGIFMKNKRIVALSIEPLMIILISLASPANGYYGRYTYPIVVILPLYLYFCTQFNRIEEE